MGLDYMWLSRQIYTTGSNVIHQRFDTIEGEAMAIKEAMNEMIQRGFFKYLFWKWFKDCCWAISSNYVGSSEFCMLISSIMSLLMIYPNFEVKFIKRQANRVELLVAAF
jgi:hypothetical protein